MINELTATAIREDIHDGCAVRAMLWGDDTRLDFVITDVFPGGDDTDVLQITPANGFTLEALRDTRDALIELVKRIEDDPSLMED